MLQQFRYHDDSLTIIFLEKSFSHQIEHEITTIRDGENNPPP